MNFIDWWDLEKWVDRAASWDTKTTMFQRLMVQDYSDIKQQQTNKTQNPKKTKVKN